jgi:hypothetical protein
MSFLQQLKRQAQALQSDQGVQQQGDEANAVATEVACKQAWAYFNDLVRQLNVIEPAATFLGVDKRSPWSNIRQTGFRMDARKKKLREKEVFDYIAVGWQLLPRSAEVQRGRVSVNFPPDLDRVQKRLAAGHVVHERLEQRHPETNALLAIVFEYDMSARASILVTAHHEAGQLHFRLGCVGSMEVLERTLAADQVNSQALDELARLVVGEPSRFL